MALVEIVTAERAERRPLGERTSFGRLPGQDVQLLDTAASKEHFVIYLRDGRHWVRDVGSLNGTFINGVQLQGEQPLRDGDQICVGSITVRFLKEQAAPTSVPAPAPKTLHPNEESIVRLARTLMRCPDEQTALEAGLRVICTESGVLRGVLFELEEERVRPRARRMPPGEELITPPFDLLRLAAVRGAMLMERVDAGKHVVVVPLVVLGTTLGILWLAPSDDTSLDLAGLREQAALLALVWQALRSVPGAASKPA